MGEGLGSFGRKRARLGVVGLAALAGAGCFPIARAGVYLEGTVRAVDASGRPRSGVEMRVEDPGVPHRWREPPFQKGLCTTAEDGACAFQLQYLFCRTIYLTGAPYKPVEFDGFDRRFYRRFYRRSTGVLPVLPAFLRRSTGVFTELAGVLA